MLFPADLTFRGLSVRHPSLAPILLSKPRTALAGPCPELLSRSHGTHGVSAVARAAGSGLVAVHMQKVE